MAAIYHHEYAELSVYSNAVALLRGGEARSGAHVDVGCGYGAIAEVIKNELNREYFGFDLAEDGLQDLKRRGFTAHGIDLSKPEAAEQIIREAVNGLPIVSISILDTLEHVTNGQQVLEMLRRLAEGSDATLVISAPNVTHKDLALKALVGRWDVTEAGLLDHTHVDFYNSDRLRRRTLSAGWRQVRQKDWLLQQSDQQFPAALPLLDVTTPLGGQLYELVTGANPEALVNQFVRAFTPCTPEKIDLFADRDESLPQGLSVITIVNAGESKDPFAAFESLGQQSDGHFELIVVDARPPKAPGTAKMAKALAQLSKKGIAFVEVTAPGAAQALGVALSKATRSHVAFVEQKAMLSHSWVAGLAAAIKANPNRVVWVHERDAFFKPRLSPFLDPDQNVCEFAVPLVAVRDLGLPDISVKPEAILQVLITKAILSCGIAAAPSDGPALLNPSASGSADPVPDAVLSFLDKRPIVLPPGAAVDLERTYQERRILLGRDAENAAAARFISMFPQVRELATPFLDGIKARLGTSQTQGEQPFLSIITRTQGQRLSTLSETLLSLAGQSSENFEVIIAVHGEDPAAFADVQSVVDEFPSRMTSRVRVIHCMRSGRSAPINDAINVARGEYIAVLDDDDFVFGHYVEVFEKMAQARAGNVLRAVCVRQNFEYVPAGLWPRSRAQSWFETTWPANYDAFAHLAANYTPFMSAAYPRTIFHDAGLRFDETLSTLEDWEFTTKVAALCGVSTAPDITSVYRWWTNANSSAFLIPSEEWVRNRERIIAEGSNRPLLLPSGSRAALVVVTERLQASQQRNKELEGLAAERDGDLDRLRRERDQAVRGMEAERQARLEAIELPFDAALGDRRDHMIVVAKALRMYARVIRIKSALLLPFRSRRKRYRRQGLIAKFIRRAFGGAGAI